MVLLSLLGTLLFMALAVESTLSVTLAAEPPASAPPAASNKDKAASEAGMMAMKDMQAMHEKMMAAKTPAERQALMVDHMKAMQEGMQAMQQMGACCQGKGASMHQRIDMMTMMMQMMMDRQQMMGGTGGMSKPAPTSPPAPSVPPPKP
jgi:hypothetical protein